MSFFGGGGVLVISVLNFFFFFGRLDPLTQTNHPSLPVPRLTLSCAFWDFFSTSVPPKSKT